MGKRFEAAMFYVAIVVGVYGAWWLLVSSFDAGAGGVKCFVGRNPVTSMCVDPPDFPECSAWTPPFVHCWPLKKEGDPDGNGDAG